ncbi:hypothetical protein M3J09_013495 [Ascochyta lentis]
MHLQTRPLHTSRLMWKLNRRARSFLCLLDPRRPLTGQVYQSSAYSQGIMS